MKLRLNDYIVCPECGGDFQLKIDESYQLDFSPEVLENLTHYLEVKEPDRMENDRAALLESYSNGIQAGSLTCDECQRVYPIINGIPRLLSDSLRTTVEKMGRGDPKSDTRIDSFMDEIKPVGQDTELFEQIQKANQSNYGYEWKAFSHSYNQWEQVYKKSYVHEEDEFFDKKLGLDAGCGMGRYTMVPVSKGAEMIGVDLSNAVEPSFQKSKSVPNFHVIQGDLFNLPFREKQFDFAQSIGVIHITPEPEAALTSIKKHVAPNKKIFLMVYRSFEDDNKFKHYLLKIASQMRKITSRMPSDMLYLFLYLMVPVVLVFFYIPSAIFWHLPNGKKWSNIFPYSYEQYKDRRLRDIHMNLFDRFGNPVERRYNTEEMEDWMTRADFNSYQLENDEGWNVVAITKE